jgi:hypothetical protein
VRRRRAPSLQAGGTDSTGETDTARETDTVDATDGAGAGDGADTTAPVGGEGQGSGTASQSSAYRDRTCQRDNGHIVTNARPMTSDSGTVPCARESAEA